MRSAQHVLMAWLQRDQDRRIEVKVTGGGRTSTVTVIGGPVSDQTFEGIVSAALSATESQAESQQDA